MLIALDYDRTYTLDPVFWDKFIQDVIERGHTVKCLTMRYPSEEITLPNINIVYTSRRAKKAYALENSIFIDVWIDDTPEFIIHDAYTG